jgi:transmembrane sensor
VKASERQKRASAEAAEWFAKLQAPKTSRELRVQFVAWLLESHVHVAELLRIAQVHDALDKFSHWSTITGAERAYSENVVHLELASRHRQDIPQRPAQLSGDTGPAPSHIGSELPSRQSGIWQFGALRYYAVAAAATVLLAASTITLLHWREQVIDTDRGDRREVVLSDGSIIQVDPETRLRVKYSGQIRGILLERGRALFHVAKNAGRPFLVESNGTTVRAVGTAFGVDRHSDSNLVITVAEGTVAVTPATSIPSMRSAQQGKIRSPGVSQPEVPASANNSTAHIPLPSPGIRGNRGPAETMMLVSTNQQVTVERGGIADSVRAVDSDRELAWAQGRLIFENDTVAEVVAEFNHYNRVQLRVASAELARRPISGVFNAADPESFIAFLQTVASVNLTRDDDRVITIAAARIPLSNSP